MSFRERTDLWEKGREALVRDYVPKDSASRLNFHPRFQAEDSGGLPIFYGSEAGHCWKQLCYRYLPKYKPLGEEVESLLRLHDGNPHGDSVVHWLTEMGYAVTKREQQYVKFRKKYVVSGRVDGFVEIPGEGTFILEMKGLSTNTMRMPALDIVNQGYRYQAQVYMWLTETTRTLFVIKDKNNSQLRFFELKYNPKVMRGIMRRWFKVAGAVRRERLLKREYSLDPKGRLPMACQWCRYHAYCWKGM